MSTTEPPRLQPLQAPFTPDVAASLAKWMPPGSDIEPLALFRTLMLHERLAGRMRPLGAGILGAGASVEPRLREVMIHRTCALTHAEYEWGVHAVAFGTPLGFSEAQLRSTVHGSHRDACWEQPEAVVFRLADELHRHSAISEQLWDLLREHFEQEQILELIVTAGWYHVIAYVCNGAQVALEGWAMRFPSPA
jgi:4-carboxymuconolactone decarboxylase